MISLTLLGLETSCDETAASIVRYQSATRGDILSNVVRSQISEHQAFGGVVPEIAARAHLDCIEEIITAAMKDCELDFQDLDGIAATAGPGLIGGLLVGMMTAKSLALSHNLPFIAVNHLAAHALTAGLTNQIAPPYLLLLVSGGHTQLQWVEDVGDYRRIGTTLDDALGEAFDKTAKLLGLGFPGGPEVERHARQGNGQRFDLPRPMKGRPESNFSFSGLKTALRQEAKALEPLSQKDIADLCAAFELAVADCLADRVAIAMEQVQSNYLQREQNRYLVVAGGVAANQRLRSVLGEAAEHAGFELIVPPPQLCTDNGAMIAWAGAHDLARGISHPLDFPAKSRWPLDEKVQPLIGSGKAGAKV